jgi:lipopolysaccharide transport system permease protein
VVSSESRAQVDGNLGWVSGGTSVVRIEPGRRAFDVRELWAHRELAYVLAWRDVKVRYRHSMIGASWALFQPLLTMAVLSLFLGQVEGVRPEGVPYALFAYSGLVPWMFVANAVTQSAVSLVAHQELVTKVYFPRPLIPMASTLSSSVDLAVPSVALLVMAAVADRPPTPRLLVLPVFVLLVVAVALAVGLFLAAATVRYRDVRHVVPFLIQMWFFASPVAYPTTIVPERWRTLLAINPMVGAVDGVRWTVIGGALPVRTTVVSVVVTALLVLGAFRFFRRSERFFADVV